MCVYHLFPKTEGNPGQGYCLAFLAPDDGCLDLFLNEVDAFMRLHDLQNSEKYLPDETRESLKNWHKESTLFIGRVLRGGFRSLTSFSARISKFPGPSSRFEKTRSSSEEKIPEGLSQISSCVREWNQHATSSSSMLLTALKDMYLEYFSIG